MRGEDQTITITKIEYEKLLDKAKPKPPALIYESIQRGDNLEAMRGFTANQVTILFDTLENSNQYPKTLWGAFYRQRDITILAVLSFCGLRPREACKLKYRDIDINKLTIHINGENNKQGKPRIIPFPSQLIPYFENYFKFPKHCWKNSEYLFPSAQNPYISSAHWKTIFREKILKPAGLYEMPEGNNRIPKFRTYSLRHTFANQMLEKSGMDLNAVANLLGHSKLDSTKRYLHQNEGYQEYLRDLMEKK